MKEKCIGLDARSNWSDALEGIPHAFGHTWENCYAMQLSSGHNTFLYTLEVDGVRVVCPVCERRFRGHVDIVTPYGFSGFVGNGKCPDFWKYWRGFAERQGYVCGFIGLNPILYCESYWEAFDLHRYNCIYALDLTKELEDLISLMDKNRRRQVRSAERMSDFVTDNERLLGFLLEHYSSFYKEKGASAVYDFVPDTFVELSKQKNVLLVGTEGETGINSVMMFAYTPYVGEYVLNVSVEEGQRNSVALLWWGIKELKARKVAWLNLGGGIRPGDGVAEFKERFGGRVFPLGSLKQVYDKDRFCALCRDIRADPLDLAGYFPPYRAKR